MPVNTNPIEIILFYRLIVSLPVYTQRLLVLLFGTFRVIASNSDRGQTGMTSEALGVSGKPFLTNSSLAKCLTKNTQIQWPQVSFKAV